MDLRVVSSGTRQVGLDDSGEAGQTFVDRPRAAGRN